MAFRFQKRIKLGKGPGINVSKSGITPSYRNRKGSASTKGYSVRMGISGLTYRRVFSKKKNNGCLVLFLLPLCVLLLVFSCTSEKNFSSCRDTNCANYTSQIEAQRDFDSDPECRNDLDADNDGIACEEPGNSVKTCASTSNCGCSNKNKTPCQADPCCRWIVGEGCECS